jgi:protein TonB
MSRKSHFRRYLPVLLATAVVISIGAGVTWLIKGFMEATGGPAKKTVQHVTLLAPPPPPPPPPKVEEPLPEPEVDEEVDIPEPETMEDLPEAPGDEPPPSDALGLDAEGGAGSDAFGLVGRKGGRSLLSGAGHQWYARDLTDGVHESLYQYRKIRSQAYTVVVNLWIASDGRITRAELEQGSGRDELDAAITDALLATRLAKAPPDSMPQPVRVRINSRL